MFVKEDLGDRKVLRENLTRTKNNNFNPTSYYANRSACVYFNNKTWDRPTRSFYVWPFPTHCNILSWSHLQSAYWLLDLAFHGCPVHPHLFVPGVLTGPWVEEL